MKNQTREVLLMTRTAQQWQEDFDEKVAELMDMLCKLDNEQQVSRATETINVYQEAAATEPKVKGKAQQRPFQFLTFRN